MEVAKVTSKGQITIPVSVRRRLGISEGDKLLFLDRQDGVMIVNPNQFQAIRNDSPQMAQPSPNGSPQAAQPSPNDRPLAAQPIHIDSPQAAQPSANDEPAIATRTAAIANEPPDSDSHPQPAQNAQPDPPKKELDVIALLNEIRSIGSNI